MKKAFIITVYHLPKQLNIFLEQLLVDYENEIFIHVDRKFDNIIPQIMKHDRIHMFEHNVAVNWGSDENLKSEIMLYKEVLRFGIDFEYVFLCSGQDLLVRKGLNEYLEENKGKPFLGIMDSPYYEKYNRAQTLYIWPEFFRRNYPNKYHPYRIMRGIWRKLTMTGKVPFGKKKIDFDISSISFHYFNYAWPVLPYDMVKYLVEYVDNNPGYMDIFSGAFDPEEMFYGIFFMNSPFASRITFSKRRFSSNAGEDGAEEMWSESLLFQYKQTKNENHPPILTVKDKETIENSGCFFARKFDERVDTDIIFYFKNKIIDSREQKF